MFGEFKLLASNFTTNFFNECWHTTIVLACAAERAIAGGFLAQAIRRELIKFLPDNVRAIAAFWATAYTWVLGEGACVYFGDLMGGKKLDPKKIQSFMQEAFQAAKERFKGIKR